MSTLKKITELQGIKAALELGGGKEKTDKQHAAGKLTARERLNLLFDEGSFIEFDVFAGSDDGKTAPAEGVIAGYGTIGGRLTYAYAQDFTVIGGAMGMAGARKICKVIDMALKTGAPVVSMSDSAGARIDEGLDALAAYGEIFNLTAKASGVIPLIAAVMGTCAGGASFIPALSDFTFMPEKTAHMFVNSAQITAGTTGKVISEDELGGAKTHGEKSGLAHFVCADDTACIEGIKKLLSYLPSNNMEQAFEYDCDEADMNRISTALMTVIPDDINAEYDVKTVVSELVDADSFYEASAEYAKSMIVGFARMGGKSVGIVANNAGALIDIAGAEKAAKFIKICDSFNIPVITLTDTEGFAIGEEFEVNGIAKSAAKLIYAYAQATVPKINIITRKAYGSAYLAMCSKNTGADVVLAWPTAEISVMAPEGAACIMFAGNISSKEARMAKAEEYRASYANPYEAAKRGYADDIIEPDSTRPRIISALEMLATKREDRPLKKHGNI